MCLSHYVHLTGAMLKIYPEIKHHLSIRYKNGTKALIGMRFGTHIHAQLQLIRYNF